MKNRNEYRDEVQRDEASRFSAEQYISSGYFLHFHRNMEIYGVVNGRVTVTISGQKRTLESGQMAVVDSLESHSYEMEEPAEVFFFHIGSVYSRNLTRVYPKNRLPRWLLDTQYNQRLYDRIRPLFNTTEEIPELMRIGIVCQLFSDIITGYGLEDKSGSIHMDSELVPQVIQYIYDHYSEHITLETLAEEFYLSPKTLSKKIKKYLNVDFRVFVNAVRIQKAMQMRDDPQNKDKTLSEIAVACGFTNMGTFYRSYERHFKNRKPEEQ